MVVVKTKKFTLYNVYFPNGGSGDERHQFKQEFLKRFGHHLVKKAANGENIVLVGDYNVAYMDADVYNPKELSSESGFLPEERKWMAGFLEQGFIDGYRYFHPDEKNRYTWWSYFQNARTMNRGWRIDHICVSRSMEKNLKSVEILDEQTGSDHCPVAAELKI
jgi:exodeoxyribonuclease-3